MKTGFVKILFALVIMCIVQACEGEKVSRPGDLIEREQFIDLLADIRLLEGSYSAKVARPDSIRIKMPEFYRIVFEKHGVTSDRFYASYDYYLHDADAMLALEDDVMARLVALEVKQAEVLKKNPGADTLQVDTLQP